MIIITILVGWLVEVWENSKTKPKKLASCCNIYLRLLSLKLNKWKYDLKIKTAAVQKIFHHYKNNNNIIESEEWSSH